MARKLVKKDVETRVKLNKSLMKLNKVAVNNAMQAAVKGEVVDFKSTRECLSNFIKSSQRVNSDLNKLSSIGE